MNRTATTTVTLVVLALLTVGMGWLGARWVSEPLPQLTASDPLPFCDPLPETDAEFVRRKDVRVSVFNSGEKAGHAQAVLTLLENAGFKAGAVGNAPEGMSHQRAVVYSVNPDSTAAHLVAAALGPKTEVIGSQDALGPGVMVVIGDKFKRLDPGAVRKLEIPAVQPDCVPVE